MERLRGLRVLVVDDEDEVLEAIGDILTVAGCRVERAATIGEARAKVSWTRPAVVLCDWNLGGEDSAAFLCALAREQPHVARLLVTGAHCDEWEALVAIGVVQRAVLKPFDMRELLGATASAATASVGRASIS